MVICTGSRASGGLPGPHMRENPPLIVAINRPGLRKLPQMNQQFSSERLRRFLRWCRPMYILLSASDSPATRRGWNFRFRPELITGVCWWQSRTSGQGPAQYAPRICLLWAYSKESKGGSIGYGSSQSKYSLNDIYIEQ